MSTLSLSGASGFSRRTAICATLLVLDFGVSLRPALAQTYILNRSNVPLWAQQKDMRTLGVAYANKPTDLMDAAGTAQLTYSQLAPDIRVRLLSPFWQLAPYASSVDFADSDYYTGDVGGANTGNNLAGGNWDCCPTSTGMWLRWVRQNRLTHLPAYGSAFGAVTELAPAMDTNDVNVAMNAGTNGHFGTYQPDAVAAADAIFKTAYPGTLGLSLFRPRAVVWNYSERGFRRLIDINKPPVVFYANPTGTSGHVVVGVGYNGADAVVRDPWTATERSRAFAAMVALGAGGGVPYGNPPSAEFDANWERVRFQVGEIMDFGDAPSSYLAVEPPAAHQSWTREWLGSEASGEVDPFSTEDDEDGEANVNDRDHDDGVQLQAFAPGPGGGLVRILVSSVESMSVDTAYSTEQPPNLHVNGWVDWNRDGVWENPAERIVDIDLIGGADFEGTQSFDVAFDVPVADTSGGYWARIRLDRGEDVGPYGYADFGEVEDHLFGTYVRGDANSDGSFDISDAIFLLSALFTPGGQAPDCDDAADANDDGSLDISDAVYILSSLFVFGPPPPAPHPACGTDPTDDTLGCSAPPIPCDGP